MEPTTKNFSGIKDSYEKISADDKITDAELSNILKVIETTPHTQEDLSAIISTLFDSVKEKFENPDDKKKIACLKKVTSAIISQGYQKKPDVTDVLFFPNEANEKKLKGYLELAQKDLKVCVYTISNDHLAKSLLGMHKKGVKIRIITDDECCKNRGSDIKELSDAGIPVKTDDDKEANMHHKFVIVDDRYVINGSFNWTYTAVKRNNENIVVQDSPDLAKTFAKEFERLWAMFPDYKF